MNVLITGGTGFIGQSLVKHLLDAGYTCYILSRHPVRARQQLCGVATVLAYDETWPPVEAVVNLAGESPAGLWTKAKQRRILQSRVQTTMRLVDWMRRVQPRPKTFISMSAVGIYGHRPGESLTEASQPDPLHNFRARVTLAWEAEANAASALGVRVVTMRVANVLHPDGGYLGPLLAVYRLLPVIVGLGNSEHHFSWISRRDTVRLLHFALETRHLEGPINGSAPNPVTAAAFTHLLAQALGKPAWGRLPDWLLKWALGSLSAALLDSQYVLPVKAEAHGFHFCDPDLGPHLRRIL